MAPFQPIEYDGLPWPFKVYPTPTNESPATLVARQQAETVTVVSDGGGGGGDIQLGKGALAGIIIGTIAGTLLLLWVIRSCFALAPRRREPRDHYVEPKRRHHHHSHHRSRSPSRKSRSRRRSSDVSVPPPVVIQDHSRRSGHPGYVQYPHGGRHAY